MGINTQSNGQLHKSYIYLVSMVAAVGGFLFGYDLAIISGAMIFVGKHFHLDSHQLGFATASALLGCMAGPLIGGVAADRFGRRKALVAAALLFGIGAIGTALPRNITEFYIFRIVGGLGVGLASIVSPMYIAEISPARMRGRLVTINQLAIVVGLLCSVVVAYYLSFSGSWRWMFASNCIPVVCLLIGLMFVPESPRWMVEKGRLDYAREVVARIEGRERAEQEISEIAGSLNEETGTYSEIFRPGVRIALWIGCGLAVFSQLTGVSILLMYAPIVFQKAGFHNASDAIFQSLMVNIWNLICTIAALYLVDRSGRRPLLLAGTAGMAIGLGLMGMFFYQNASGFAVLVTMFISVGAFVIGLAPISWLIMSEIFPTRIRGKAMGIATLCLWISSFLTAEYFPAMAKYFEDHFGSPAGVFWIYAAVCVTAFVFILKMVPETKGRTLEEIGASWTRKKYTDKSV